MNAFVAVIVVSCTCPQNVACRGVLPILNRHADSNPLPLARGGTNFPKKENSRRENVKGEEPKDQNSARMFDALDVLTRAAAAPSRDGAPRSENLAPKAWPKWALCPPIPGPAAEEEDEKTEEDNNQTQSRAIKWPRMSLLPAPQIGGNSGADSSFGSVVRSA